jgi:Leucine-rich repeat (LRR) protein
LLTVRRAWLPLINHRYLAHSLCLEPQPPLNLTTCVLLLLLSLSLASGLRKLIAGHNMIACVAAGWAQLTALTHLDFHYCHIMAIDPALGALTALEVLNLSGNLLKLLPATFSRLVSLRMLLVAGNQLTDLPPGLTALRALQEVDVMGNPFQALPASLVTLGESEGTALARVWLGVGDKHLVAEGAQSVGHAAIAWRG